MANDSNIPPFCEWWFLIKDATDGGSVAGTARKDIENRLGKSVISKANYLKTTEGRKRIGKK